MINCEICARTSLKGNQKSHSNVKTIKRQKVNIQSKRIDGKKMNICTSCIKNVTKLKTK